MTENPEGAAAAKEVTEETPDQLELTGGAAAENVDAPNATAETEREVIGEEVKAEPAAETVPTVREIFGLPEKGIAESGDDRWNAIQERLGEEVKGIKWTAAMPDLAPKLCQLLEIKIPDVLLAAWKKAGELQAVIEKSKLTPEEMIYLELAEHSINSEHKPSIDVKLRGAKVKTIQLLVQLGFKLKGFVIKIQNGAIREIQTGQCEVKGTIKYAGLNIAEKKLAPIKLPLTIPLEDFAALLQVPASEEEMPSSEEEVPASEQQVPASEEPVPASEEEVPASEGQIPEREEKHEKSAEDLERIEL
jgi:hypothetical protein